MTSADPPPHVIHATHLIVTTCADETAAMRLARRLVEQRVVACVNLVPGIRSIYRWQGEIQDATEVMLLMKTAVEPPAVIEAIRCAHDYAVPEVICVPIESGLPAYLAWVAENTLPLNEPGT